jgi:AbrB family looped-hinge helix DNA binding protein
MRRSMAISTTKMSSKGQVVIPDEIRKRLKLREGAHFVVLGEGDTVVLKRVAPPAVDDIRDLLADAEKQAKQTGLTKADVSKAISHVRKRR